MSRRRRASRPRSASSAATAATATAASGARCAAGTWRSSATFGIRPFRSPSRRGTRTRRLRRRPSARPIRRAPPRRTR
ncbi:MAG: hypothetical protein CMM02_08000, partial [Rhodopirellula sp.]|nr:hypothetical protein [Rhodopirellula sp.]